MKTHISPFVAAALLASAWLAPPAAADETDPPAAQAGAQAPAQSPAEGASGHKFELAKRYYAECQGVGEGDFDAIRPRLKAFTDAEIMADMMADPAEAAMLAEVVMDPRTMHVMMKCAMEPVMWETWVRGLSDPDKLARAAARFMNPGVYMAWMTAPMNPQVQQSMYRMASPELYARWTTALANPAFYQPMLAFGDPSFYTPRVGWMMNPASFQPVFEMWNGTMTVPATSAAQ